MAGVDGVTRDVVKNEWQGWAMSRWTSQMMRDDVPRRRRICKGIRQYLGGTYENMLDIEGV